MENMNRHKVQRSIKDFSFIFVGCILAAVGYAFFINPYNIVPGGISGIGIVIHDLYPHISVAQFSFAMDVPLIIIGTWFLGGSNSMKYFLTTLITAFLFFGLMELAEQIIHASDYFVNKRDPLGLHDDILLATIFGAIITGVGFGLIFKARASTGGSSIITLIVVKLTKIPTGRAMILVDSTIVIVGFIVFKDWKIPLYSWLSIYICGQVIDMTLKGMQYDNALMIISKHHAQIADIILNTMGRGATYLHGEGAFTGEEKHIIFTVVSQRELPILEYHIHQIDPEAFVTNIDTREILGDGFNSLSEKLNH